MTENFKVTVIMSNYNQEKYIEQAIQSVLNQKTNFPVQLIITDDCSTKDNSVEIIKKYEAQYPDKIKALYNQENGRYLKNILRAKAITKTPYFCLLDSDDYWTDMDYLQNAVDFLDAHPDYTIYSRNVICQTEDGLEHLFVPEGTPTSDFTIDDYLNHHIAITQTAGSFFRNVIFKDGIPPIMEKAIGTISERSFEGDFDRYLMHLKYGKAHYEPKPSGVYRILADGIWQRLNLFEKSAIQAQAFLDYDLYFEKEYHAIFMNKMWGELKRCISYLSTISSCSDLSLRDEAQEKFANCLRVCVSEREILNIGEDQQKKIKKLKYRIMKKIYDYCRKKLRKKGLI